MKKKKKKRNIDQFLESKEGTKGKNDLRKADIHRGSGPAPEYTPGTMIQSVDGLIYVYTQFSDGIFRWKLAHTMKPNTEQTFADYLGWTEENIQDGTINVQKNIFKIHNLHSRAHMTVKDIDEMSDHIFKALLKQPISKVGAAMKQMGSQGDDKSIKAALAAIIDLMGEGEGEEQEKKKKDKTPEEKEAEKKAQEDLEKQLRAAMSQSKLSEEEKKEFAENMKQQSQEQKEDKALEDFQDVIKEKANERVKEMIAEALAPIRTEENLDYVKGQHYKYPLVLKCISCIDVNVALVGPAGSGKTRLVEEVAKTLALHFSPQSFNCLSSKADILGFVDAGGTYHASVFRERFENGGVFLADEFDACHPGVATILNAAIANKLCTFGDNKTVKAHANFKAVMCMNTFGTGPNAEYVGRNRLDAATLDRFAFIYLDYDEVLEFSMIGIEQKPKPLNLSAGGIGNAAAWIIEVQKIRELIKTNKMRMIVSPRATIMGAELCAVGVGLDWLRELLVFKGISENDREQLNELMKPPAPKVSQNEIDAIKKQKDMLAGQMATQMQQIQRIQFDPQMMWGEANKPIRWLP